MRRRAESACRVHRNGYCWRIYFKVLEVLFLVSVSQAFLPSKMTCGTHTYRHGGFANSIGAFLSKIQFGCMRGLVKAALTSNPVGFSPVQSASSRRTHMRNRLFNA